MAGEQQQPGDADQFVVGQVVAVLPDQHAEDVVARFGSRAVDQGGHVRPAFALQLDGEVSTVVEPDFYRMKLAFQMQDSVAAAGDDGARRVVLTSAARRGAQH